MRRNIGRVSVLAAVAMFVCCTGCFANDAIVDAREKLFDTVNFEDDTNYTSVQSVTAIECDYYAPVSITYGYESLNTEEQRSCYNQMTEKVYNIAEEKSDNGLYAVGKIVVESGNFSEGDMRLCISAFSMDNPDVFWISNQFSYGSIGNKTTLQLYSYTSGADCKNKIAELNTRIEEIIATVPSELKPYHLEKYIHNTIMESCEYAQSVNSTDDGWEEFSSYGALVNGSAVCEGYAYSMSLLLNRVGIPAYCVNGSSQGELHMWNTVQIDGNWYHTDATWDDSEGAYYNYFNLNQTQIEQDHIIAKTYGELTDDEMKLLDSGTFNIYIPECVSDSANYYVVESTFINDFVECEGVMVSDLITAAQNHDKEFTIRFDGSMDFQECLDVMFYEEPYYLFGYLNKANESLSDDCKFNSENAQIIILEQFNSIILKLEYLQ